MNNLIKNDELEKILLKNWTNVLDHTKLMAATLQSVDLNQLEIIEENDLPQKGIQVTLSQFNIMSTGFIIWVDFTFPSDKNIAVGTSEFHLTNSGELTLRQTVGTLFMPKQHEVV